MEKDRILEEIYKYGDEAHGDQLRKYTPDRYMVHPRRVMNICEPYYNSLPILAAALLHDVLEDTPVTHTAMLRDLQQFMSRADAEQTVKLVVELTDVYEKAAYPQLNRRKRKAKEVERMRAISTEAQTIKYADILDNASEIIPYDRQFAPVFLRECKTLLEAMDKGHPELREKALTVVKTGLNHH